MSEPDWPALYLQRLGRLLALETAHAGQLNARGRRLLQHAIFTTYVDCRGLGWGAAAMGLLAGPAAS